MTQYRIAVKLRKIQVLLSILQIGDILYWLVPLGMCSLQ